MCAQKFAVDDEAVKITGFYSPFPIVAKATKTMSPYTIHEHGVIKAYSSEVRESILGVLNTVIVFHNQWCNNRYPV